VIEAYYCPSQLHDSKILAISNPPSDGHNHPSSIFTQADKDAGGVLGALSDYRGNDGSPCPKANNLANAGVTSGQLLYPVDLTGYFGALSNGPIPMLDKFNAGQFVRTEPPKYPNNRGVASWRPRTAFKDILDGTSKTVLGGEVGRATSEIGHAFNGDHNPGIVLGVGRVKDDDEVGDNGFADEAGLGPGEGGDLGFGSVHPGVVLFVMCDGSVHAISKDTDLWVLDAMATRAEGEIYSLDGAGPLSPNCYQEVGGP